MLPSSFSSVLGPSYGSSNSISSGRSSYQDEYYSNRDIEILHHVIKSAQESWDSQPERERVPTNLLFKAYDAILPTYGIDPETDSHLSKIVFRTGGERGPGGLLDKFRTVLSRMGIEIEIGDDNGTEPGKEADAIGHDEEEEEEEEEHGFAEEEEEDENGGIEHRGGYGRYDYGYEDDTIPLENGYPLTHATPGLHARRVSEPDAGFTGASPARPRSASFSDTSSAELSFSHVGAGIDARADLDPLPAPHSTAGETELTRRSLDSLVQEAPGASDTTVQVDEPDRPATPVAPKHAMRPAQRHVPLPASPLRNSLRPLSGNVRDDDADGCEYERPARPVKTVTFQSPSRQFVYPPEISPPSSPIPHDESMVHDENAENEDEEEEQDAGRRDVHEMSEGFYRDDDIPELTGEELLRYQQLERRAYRAHMILITRSVIVMWSSFVDYVDDRRTVARRHMLRFRYFGLWQQYAEARDGGAGLGDLDGDEENYDHQNAHGAAVAGSGDDGTENQTDLADQTTLRPPGDVADGPTTLHPITPPSVDHDPYMAFLDRTATQWWEQHLLKRSLSRWAAHHREHERRDEEAADHRSRFLGNVALLRARQLCARPREQQTQGFGPWQRRAGEALAGWRQHAEEQAARSARAEQLLRANLLGRGLRQWQLHDAASRQFEQRAACVLRDPATIRWASLANPAWRHSTRSPEVRRRRPAGDLDHHHDDEPDAALLARCNAVFEASLASRVLWLWGDLVRLDDYEKRQAKCRAAVAVGMRALDAWERSAVREVELNEWADRGHFYVQGIRVIDRWRGPPAQAYKRRARSAYAQVKRDCRARLAGKTLVLWKAAIDEEARKRELSMARLAHADSVLQGRVLDKWKSRLDLDADLQARTLGHFARRCLDLWRDAHADLAGFALQCEDLWAEQVQSRCLAGWEMTSRRLKGQEHMAEDALRQNNRRLLRQAFDIWVGDHHHVHHVPNTPAPPPTALRRGTPARLVIHRRNPRGGGGVDARPQQQTIPMTPWTAPSMPVRTHRPFSTRDATTTGPMAPLAEAPATSRDRRQPGEHFEAGDPDDEAGPGEAAAGTVSRGGQVFLRSVTGEAPAWASTTPRTPAFPSRTGFPFRAPRAGGGGLAKRQGRPGQ